MKFTQFLRPDGRRRTIEIERPPEIEEKAKNLVLAGCRLEAEVLPSNQVSFTVEDDNVEEYGALAHEIVMNGPAVPEAVDRLIERAEAQRLLGVHERSE